MANPIRTKAQTDAIYNASADAYMVSLGGREFSMPCHVLESVDVTGLDVAQAIELGIEKKEEVEKLVKELWDKKEKEARDLDVAIQQTIAAALSALTSEREERQ